MGRKIARVGAAHEYSSPPPFNRMAQATPTSPPVMFEPPRDLTDGHHEVWIAAGGTDGWGGCEVWASLNNESYDKIGLISPGSIVGELSSPLPAGPDPHIDATFQVYVGRSRGQIHPGADSDADQFMTLCWVGGEFLAHTAATLIALHQYRMDKRFRRGVFSTSIKDHPVGTPFVRLNQGIFRAPYPAHLVGATIHVKLPSFNEHQQMLQTLDEVPSYSMTITGMSAK